MWAKISFSREVNLFIKQDGSTIQGSEKHLLEESTEHPYKTLTIEMQGGINTYIHIFLLIEENIRIFLLIEAS